VQDKIDHVYRFAVQLAVAREAMHGVGLGIHLHARGLVIVEGTTKLVALIGFQSVMVEHLADGEMLFDFSDFHRLLV
jgi:hypothetical protein